jgi:hypothetical protein
MAASDKPTITGASPSLASTTDHSIRRRIV